MHGREIEVANDNKCPDGEHDYHTTYMDWEKETLTCSKCGDSYSLYDDEMR